MVEYETFELWTCAGCDKGTMAETWTADFALDEHGKMIPSTTLHPRRSERSERLFKKLPKNLKAIYREVVEACNGRQTLLCAVGLRSLIEGVCVQQGVAGRNLGQKLDGLKTQLPDSLVDSLHSLRFMGNEAVHDLEAPPIEEIRLALDIEEDLLNYLYDLDYKASQLAKVRAERKGKAKARVKAKAKTKSRN
jgi:hypothetical protein